MQHRAVHHDSPRADLDALRAGVQINPFIEIGTMTEPDMVCKPQADATFDRRQAVHVEDEAIKDAPQSHAHDGRDPSEQEKDDLLENISKWRGGLPVKIETNAVQHGT